VNWFAIKALACGITVGCVLCVLPHCFREPGLFRELAHLSWVSGALVAGLVYRFLAAEEEPLVITPAQVIRARQLL
jgi:cytosine/uracil/thiamine/allantoin permease